MKTGIIMLIIGLIVAGAGVTAWLFSDSYLSASPNDETIMLLQAVGLGGTIIGGGLGLGGIIRMIVKR